MIACNINHIVKIKLTDLGRQVLRKPEVSCTLVTSQLHPAEVDGWSEWQLWELMRIFGPYLGNGCPLVFETNIQVPETSPNGCQVFMAQEIKPESWLAEPCYETFQRALGYAGSQTMAISGLSKLEPEELYYVYEMLKRGERMATGKIMEHQG